MTFEFNPKNLDRFFVGFDPIIKKFADASKQFTQMRQLNYSNYPPYNIKKVDENKYIIEMAVAGFGKQDLVIELHNDTLTIRGMHASGEPAEQDTDGDWTWPCVMYNGLAKRAFTQTFQLANTVDIRNASLVNGILKIVLDNIIDNKPAVVIDIDDGKK